MSTSYTYAHLCGMMGEVTCENLNCIHFRFTSKERDSEIGLYSFPARYCESRLSRWMSADLAGGEIINPQKNDSLLVSAVNWVQLF